ncbi:MAG: Crp/Fnr family transcriptional regulator [Bacteroidales bacterium]
MNIELCPICGHLPKEEQKKFLASLHAVTKHYKRGDFIAIQGDKVDSLYLLVSGSVKTEMVAEGGTVLTIETIAAPHPLAPAFLFAQNNRFPVDVTAMEDCEVILIPKAAVMRELADNPHFLQSYMAFNANRTQFLSEKVHLLSIKTIKGKLAYYIMQRISAGVYKMDKNQTELADYFGVARPSLSRSFSEMIEDGAISRDGKVLNFNKLKEYELSEKIKDKP